MRILLAFLIAIVSLTYLLPFAIAYGRNRTNTGAIFAVNFCLGWTMLGWVAALVWSLSHDSFAANNHASV